MARSAVSLKHNPKVQTMTLLQLLILCAIGIDLWTMPAYETVPPMNFVREIIGLGVALLIVAVFQVADRPHPI
jgi:hypothetical protein